IDLLSLAEISEGGRILEIGCGTGKATVLFAPYGNQITCLEPGESLAAFAEQNLSAFQNVQIVRSRFEDWQGQENAFDLITSAQAFHWVDREIAFEKAARLLKQNGAIGLFWNRPDEAGAPYRQAFDTAYARYGTESDDPQNDDSQESWAANWKSRIEASGRFSPVLVRRYFWSHSYDAEQYLELLGTYSNHILLADQKRRALYQAIRDEIE